MAGNFLRHDPEGSVCELVNPPELVCSTGKFRNSLKLSISSSGKSPVSSFDDNLVVRSSEIAASLRNRDY